MRGIGWVALWLTPSLAQAAPDPGPAAERAPAERDAPATPLHEDWSWVDAVPVDSPTRVFMGLAAIGDRALAIDGGGGVWRSETGGQRWRLVLEPLLTITGPGDAAIHDIRIPDSVLDPEDEARALAKELRQEDPSLGTYEDDEESDELDEDSLDSSEDAPPAVVEAEGLILEELLRETRGHALQEGGLRIGGTAWFHPDLPDLALVGRADGIWRSTDGGLTWHRVDPASNVTTFHEGTSPLLLAGTADGLLYSVDGGRVWLDKEDPMDGTHVRDLARSDDGTWWCATSKLVYRSDDGEFWEWAPIVGIRDQDVAAIVPEPGSTSLLLADNETLYRTDDRGQTVVVLGRQPLLDTTRLIRAPGPGHLLQSGSDGVWESVDGGLSWRPLFLGLRDPQVFDLAWIEGTLFAATLNGLFRLAEGLPSGDPGLAPETVYVELRSGAMPLSSTVAIASHRLGVDPGFFFLRRSRVARALPYVEVYGRLRSGDDLDTNFENPPSSLDLDRDAYVGLRLRWGGPDLDVLDDVGLGGLEALADDFQHGLPLRAANTYRSAMKYQHAVAETVTDLYLSREKLLSSWDTIPSNDLRAAVLHVLKIQEVSARLDGYTDGAFSAATPSEEAP